MVDISTLSVVIAAASVVVGVIFAILELRNVVKQRQTDLVMRLYSTFASDEFQEEYMRLLNLEFKDYDSYLKKHGLSGVIKIGTFFEGIGVLLSREIIDINFVSQLFSQSIKLMWEKTKPIFEGARKQYDQPRWGERFEFLYHEMKRTEQGLQPLTTS